MYIDRYMWKHDYLLLFFSQETYTVSPSSPHLTIEDFRKQAMAIFREYFEHGDTLDVTVSDTNIFTSASNTRVDRAGVCSIDCTL